MHGIIDYAGLFPPAKLPLDTAIRNYAEYRKDADAWMLSRFIIPAAMLPKISEYADELFTQKHPFAFSVLGKGTETIEEYEREIEKILNNCTEFCQAHPGSITTGMLEIKLPQEAAFSHDVDLLNKLMNETADKLNQSAIAPHTIFYEGFLDESWKKDTEAILQAISAHNETRANINENHQFTAFKIRCGGVEADQFPSVEQLAFILNRARKYNVALKGTAGLHHPVRHYAEEVQTKMHGFFNAFGGAMLASANNLNDTVLEEILKEEDAEQFTFTDDAFTWKDYSVSTEQIKKLREDTLLSFGSCSFDDPREDLAQLKLL